MDNIEQLETTLINDPSTSYWLKQQLQITMTRDPLDGLNDAELLVMVLKFRLDNINKQVS
ncbi:MAG: hypothetical protein ACI92O_000290 [Colwellia sp.]|jgi:hypothetical protein